VVPLLAGMNTSAGPLWVLDSGLGDPAWNMALDEALLASSTSRGKPVLRFYGWTEPAATFGYFQHFAEVESRTRLRPLIRRPTGGGIVPHLRDWTYSLSVPPGHPWHRMRAIDSYRTMHEWIVRAFAGIQFPTELAPCCRKDAPGACFEGYEQFDVLWQGRKIAGAAQRRNQLGLLIQGSVQPPPQADRADWQSAMLRALPPDQFSTFEAWTPDAALVETTRGLAESKYAGDAYNRLR